MSVIVKKVESKKDLKIFARLHHKLYQDDEYYVPELDMEVDALLDRDKNPFFKEAEADYFLAYQNGEVVGRITAHIVHSHNDYWKENIGWFGFWLCPNDRDVAFALLDTAYEWVKAKGCTAVRGPANFCYYHEWGLLVEGFNTPHNVMNTYNHYYYQDLLEAYERDGRKFENVKNMYSYFYDLEHSVIPERIHRINQRHLKKGEFRVRPFRMKDFATDVEHVFRLLNKELDKNWGSIPVPQIIQEEISGKLKTILDPELVLFAENKEGLPIALILVLPNVNEMIGDFKGRLFWPPWNILKFLWRAKVKRTRHVRLWAMAIAEDYRKRGADALLYEAVYHNARRRGYKIVDIGWVLETTYDIRRAVEKVGGRKDKTHRLYQIELVPGAH